MNAKHTPGPWIVRPYLTPDAEDDPQGVYLVVEACNKLTDRYEQSSGEDPELEAVHAENQANARLIAAAPELLEALKDAVSNLELQSDCISEAEWIASDEKAVWEKARTAIARAEGKDSP